MTEGLAHQGKGKISSNSLTFGLEKAGFGYLSMLLDKKEEKVILRNISQQVISAKDRVKQFDFNLGKGKIEITFIPSKLLIGIYTKDEAKIELSNTGKILRAIHKRFSQLEIGINFFLTSGSVDEITRDKPSHKRNGKDSNFIDNDLVAVVHNQNVSEELINSLIRLDIPNEKDLESEVKHSCWRHFTIVEIRDNGISKAQIAFPENNGFYQPNLTFLEFAMSRRNCPHILLIPTNNPEGFVGALIDFFPERKSYNHVSYRQKDRFGKSKRQSLKPIIYHWPTLAFPTLSIAEALYHFLHEFRTWTWGDQLPLADFGKRGKFQWKQLLCRIDYQKREVVKNMSRQLSEWFATEIIYPIARNPSLIIKEAESLKIVSNRLLTALERGFDGDPSLGLIRSLSRGENPTNLPAYGTGVIDPKGFFPELYEFLHTGDRLGRLIELMAETEAGPAMKGWPTFLNFLYQETGYDIRYLVRLLNPSFCSMEIYPTPVEDFIKKDLNPI